MFMMYPWTGEFSRMLASCHARSSRSDPGQGSVQRVPAARPGPAGQASRHRRERLAVGPGRAGPDPIPGPGHRGEGGAMSVRVRPVRFTNDITAMRRFLEVLGLRPRITGASGTWVAFTAPPGGMVGLHDAAAAITGYTATQT